MDYTLWCGQAWSKPLKVVAEKDRPPQSRREILPAVVSEPGCSSSQPARLLWCLDLPALTVTWTSSLQSLLLYGSVCAQVCIICISFDWWVTYYIEGSLWHHGRHLHAKAGLNIDNFYSKCMSFARYSTSENFKVLICKMWTPSLYRHSWRKVSVRCPLSWTWGMLGPE